MSMTSFFLFSMQLLDLIKCIDGIKYLADVGMQPVFQAVLSHWSKIVHITEVLEIPYLSTKLIQSTSFALTDFYGCWLKMHIQLENHIKSNNDETGLAQALVDTLNKRKKQLLSHPAMICGVFLDPRFYYDLSDTEKNFARLNLKQIWNRFAQFKTNNDMNVNTDEQKKDLLEQYFVDKNPQVVCTYKEKTNGPNFYLHIDEFMETVERYETKLPRIHHTVSILDYWSERIESSCHIHNFSELQFVAITILSIPSSQVPCERNFSDLSFVFNSKRTRIDAKLLEMILFIRTNRQLFQKVKHEHLQSMKV